MEHLLFAGYLLLFAWIVTKVKFFTHSGLNNSQLIIIFLLKVMAGILYGWVGIYYGVTAQMVDTWSFHYLGLQEYKLLQTNPSEYFSNLLNNPFEGGYLKFLSGHDSFWNELKAKSIIKMLSVFDILSFGNYYINIIFYSFITLFGPIGIYRIMKDVFAGKNTQIAISAFLLPSFLYWNSGIHKEGIIFTGIILIIYNLYFAFAEKKLKPKRIILILIGLLLITLLRNFFLLIICPAIVAWFLATRFPRKALGVFVIVYLVSGVLFFVAKYISPAFDFPSIVVSKQKEFLEMYGGSMVPVKELRPTAIDFIKTIPQAFSLSTLRPYPGDVKHIFSLAAAIEINFFLFLFVIFLFCRTNGLKNRIFIYFCIFFSVSTLLSIGYTVNFLGAIVRYRSVVLPFLVIPMVALIDWNKLVRLLFNNAKPA